MSPIPSSLPQSSPTLHEAKVAAAAIPPALRSRVAAAIAGAAKSGGAADEVVRRTLLALNRRILRAQRRHRDDREAEALADAIERCPDAALAIASWALTWAPQAAGR